MRLVIKPKSTKLNEKRKTLFGLIYFQNLLQILNARPGSQLFVLVGYKNVVHTTPSPAISLLK